MSVGESVDIVLPVHDGAAYLEEQIRSLQEQEHREWRLWVRDDDSTDPSSEVVRDLAAEDPRIRLHPPDGRRLGATRSFAWLLERLPGESRYVMCCDQDDRWLHGKIGRSLEALEEAEAESVTGGESESVAEMESVGPVLLHTDLVVANRDLEVVHPSFWEYQGIRPRPATLRRWMADDAVTGCTILMNRPLLDRILPIPPMAEHHDRWIALVACATGRVVSLPEPTVIYRQHPGNVVGARDRRGRTPASLLRNGLSPERARAFRDSLRTRASEAAALLGRFRDELTDEEADLLTEYAALPSRGPIARKIRSYRLHALPERGFLRNLAVLLRS